VRVLRFLGSDVLVGSNDGSLAVFDERLECEFKRVESLHAGSVFCCDERDLVLATGSNDQCIKILKDFSECASLDVGGGTVRTVLWTPSGNLLSGSSAEGVIRLWDLASEACVSWFELQRGSNALAVKRGPGQSTFVSLGSLGEVDVWDERGTSAVKWSVENKGFSLATSGNIVLVGSEAGGLECWDVRATRESLWKVHAAHEESIRAVQVWNGRVASVSFDRSLAVFSSDDGKELIRERFSEKMVSCCARGNQILASGAEGGCYLFELFN
jgi:WD40 repeat protein